MYHRYRTSRLQPFLVIMLLLLIFVFHFVHYWQRATLHDVHVGGTHMIDQKYIRQLDEKS